MHTSVIFVVTHRSSLPKPPFFILFYCFFSMSLWDVLKKLRVGATILYKLLSFLV